LAGIGELEALCTAYARRSLCHCLTVSAEARPEVSPQDTTVAQVHINSARPELVLPGEGATVADVEEPLESWSATLARLLEFCM
jgi:hypothetical protein